MPRRSRCLPRDLAPQAGLAGWHWMAGVLVIPGQSIRGRASASGLLAANGETELEQAGVGAVAALRADVGISRQSATLEGCTI